MYAWSHISQGMLFEVESSGWEGRITWTSHIRCLLERYGFSFVWISQGVGGVDVYMEIEKTKLQEHFKNMCFTDVGNTNKLPIYSTFKREFKPERYDGINFRF